MCSMFGFLSGRDISVYWPFLFRLKVYLVLEVTRAEVQGDMTRQMWVFYCTTLKRFQAS